MPDSSTTPDTPSAVADPLMSNTPSDLAGSVGTAPTTTSGTGPEAISDFGPLGGLWSDSADLFGDLPQRITSLLDLGGPVVLVLCALSVAALTIVLMKLWQFARVGVGRHGAVEQSLALWCARRPQQAIAVLRDQRTPTARLVHLAMTGADNATLDHTTLREELVRVASRQLETLRSYLRALEVIATLSPLLGLLGTVLGMIQAFQQLAIAGSQVDPALLSGGIWQALLTTALGLAVAIPVVLVHSWLERRVERCGHAMEDAVTRVFTFALTPVPRSTSFSAAATQPVPLNEGSNG